MKYSIKKAQTKPEHVPLNYFCVPPKVVHDFCLFHYDFFRNPKLLNAANIVISAYQADEEIHLDYIRTVKQFMNHF